MQPFTILYNGNVALFTAAANYVTGQHEKESEPATQAARSQTEQPERITSTSDRSPSPQAQIRAEDLDSAPTSPQTEPFPAFTPAEEEFFFFAEPPEYHCTQHCKHRVCQNLADCAAPCEKPWRDCQRGMGPLLSLDWASDDESEEHSDDGSWEDTDDSEELEGGEEGVERRQSVT